MKKDDMLSLALAVGGPLLGGQLASLPGMPNITKWYKRIKKPKWTPPNWAFGVVWPVLYTGQGLASWLVWRAKKAHRKLALGLYGAQLALNFIWQPLFFKARRPDIALVDISAVLGLSAAATVAMAKNAGSDNKLVTGLMVPYVAWTAFAAILNGRIWKENPDAVKISNEPMGATTGATTKRKAT